MARLARAIQSHQRDAEGVLRLHPRQPTQRHALHRHDQRPGRRVHEHRAGAIPGFTKKYGVKTLVYYETFGDVRDAIHRETRLKKFTRARKLELIESVNPQWRDLSRP